MRRSEASFAAKEGGEGALSALFASDESENSAPSLVAPSSLPARNGRRATSTPTARSEACLSARHAHKQHTSARSRRAMLTSGALHAHKKVLPFGHTAAPFVHTPDLLLTNVGP